MVSSFCGAMGVAGWLIMLLLWGGLIAAVVWGVSRLFPDRAGATVPAPPRQRHGEDAEAPLAESHRH
jgi:H+/Cl- antiporter ClcA